MAGREEVAAAKELVRLAGKYIRSHGIRNVEDWHHIFEHELAARPGDPTQPPKVRPNLGPPPPVEDLVSMLEQRGDSIDLTDDEQTIIGASLGTARAALSNRGSE